MGKEADFISILRRHCGALPPLQKAAEFRFAPMSAAKKELSTCFGGKTHAHDKLVSRAHGKSQTYAGGQLKAC